jgi:hypothetical protein
MTAPSPALGAAVLAGLAPVIENTRPSLTLSEVLYAAISASTDGNNTLVAGVAGKRIRVLSLVLVASGGVNTAQLQTAAGGVALTGVMDLADNGQLVMLYNPAGWCETGTGELLNMALTEATVVAGMLTYVLAG